MAADLILLQESKTIETIKQEFEKNSQNSNISIKIKHIETHQKEYLDLLADHLKNQQHYDDVSILISKNTLIGDEGYQILAQSINILTKIQKFKLQIEESCQLGSQRLFYLSEVIYNLKQLSDLSIFIGGYNSIQNEGLQNLARIFPQLQNLNRLQIKIGQFNKYDDQGVISVCENIKLVKQLTKLYLDIDGRKVNKNGVKAIAEAFQQLTNLENLEFRFDCENEFICIQYNNKIGNKGAVSIGEALGELKQLQFFLLIIQNQNEIYSERARAIAEGIQQISNLINLDISINYNDQISQIGMASFGSALSQLSNLQALKYDFSQNITNLSAMSFAEGFMSLKQLKQLQLFIQTVKNLSEENIKLFLESLQHLTNLDYLYLSFSDSFIENNVNLQSLSTSLKFMKNLKVLKLDLHLKAQNYYVFGDILGSLSQIVKLDLNLRVSVSEESVYFEQIAHGIKNLVSIQDLNLSFVSSELNENSYKLFVDIFERLINLKKLYLLIVQMKSGVLEYIGKSFLHLQNLESLNFNLELLNISDQFIDKEIIALGNGISHLINLTELSLDLILDVRASNDSINSIAKEIKSLKNLEKLYANLNNRSGQVLDILTYIDSFNYLQNAELRIEKNSYFKKINQKINLDDQKNSTENEIEEELQLKSKNEPYCSSLKSLEEIKDYKILAQSLKEQSKVQIIKLYLEKSCYIGPFGLLSLSETLQNLKEIFDLAIIINGNNYIRNDGLKYLSRIFPQLPKLKRLQIQIAQPNRYDQIGVIAIYDNIKIARLLVDLDLQIDRIKINKLGVEAIAQALLSLTNLQILNFRINDGLGLIEGAKDLAFALGQLVELKQLKFSISPQNFINSEIQVEFSNSFRNLKKIESFQIEGLYFLDKQSIISFTDIFNGLSQLKKLSLQIESSYINGQYAVLSLSNSLKNLENVSEFQITINDSCNIGVEGSLALAQAIKFMKKLTKLSIFIERNNKIGCKGALSIGEALEELKNYSFQNQIQVVTIICIKKELLQQYNVFNKYQAQINYMC
ncbi:hypothetical protein ABPG72_020470 [Tetrahymena utriculariae]